MTKQEILNNLEKLTPRSAWNQAVLSDAVDLVQNLNCSEVPNSWEALRALLLNGARNWQEYSYGGCALVYDEDIARHYCTNAELRKVTRADGTISDRANAAETWLDVQARALSQAAILIREAVGN
ncbi:hypothetical protein [Candidatus Avelusimicrobium stercoris]|uniref:hypothetical protein n=1 Tax=Candidatus Avelusimicrobium stercoris TaxID=1947924 RepID=UPI003D0A65A8